MIEMVDINDVIDEIRPGLEEVRRKTGCKWTVDDVVQSCVNGERFLFIDRQLPGCFLIVEVAAEQYTQEPILVIWSAYGGKNHGIRDGILSQVDELARRIDAKRIQFTSKHAAFARLGWTVKHIVYEREVS